MRIAFNTLPTSMTSQLAALTSYFYRLQNQAATGKSFTQLEDSASARRQVLDLQTQDSQIGQYRKNIASLQADATSSYTPISGLEKISSRAGDIATLADGTRSPAEL